MQRTTGRGVGLAFAEKRSATNSTGQLYTDGRIIYSYGNHWPLAAWIDGKLHLNDNRYSVTTSKHRSFVIGGLIKAKRYLELETAVKHSTRAEMQRVCGIID